MRSFLEKSARVSKVLRDNNFGPEADELDVLVKKYFDSGDEEVRKQITEMCHIKWLGDLNVTSISSTEWLGMLEALKHK